MAEVTTSAEWIRTRNLFNNWTIETPLREVFHANASFLGISTWWSSTIMKRDSLTSNKWLVDLHKKLTTNRYECSKESRFRRLPKHWIRNLLTDLILHLYRKSLTKNLDGEPGDIETLFICNEYNLSKDTKKLIDKNYQGTPNSPLAKTKVGLAIDLSVLLYNPTKILNYKRYWERRHREFNLPLRFTVRFNSMKQIARVYFWSLRSYLKVRTICKDECSTWLQINELDCSDILIPLIENSFADQIPRNILFGLNMVTLVDSEMKCETVVTYGEMIADMQFFYAFLRSTVPTVKLVTVQHSLLFDSKMSMIMFPEYFQPISRSPLEAAAMPDLYLLQGTQAKRIVQNFLPGNRIHVIGSLKMTLFDTARSSDTTNSESLKILVALSLGDEIYVLSCVSPLFDKSEFEWTICFHPAVARQVTNRCNALFSLLSKRVTVSSRATYDEVLASDVVVTGYSAVGIESLHFGVDSIRVIDEAFPPSVDDDQRIPSVDSSDKLMELLSIKKSKGVLIQDKQSIIEDYFGIQDDGQDKRFWDAVNALGG